MADFADPYPAWFIMELLGIPAADFDRFLGLATDLGLGFGPTAARELDRVEAALVGLTATATTSSPGAVGSRRRPGLGPGRRAGRRGAALGQELRGLLTGLVFAGQDTTRNQLGLAMTTFAAHPDQWALLAERPELAAAAVEEVLRASPTTLVAGRWPMPPCRCGRTGASPARSACRCGSRPSRHSDPAPAPARDPSRP